MVRLALLMSVALAVPESVVSQTSHDIVDSATGIVTHVPAGMELRDPAKLSEQGHIRAYGSLSNEAAEHAFANRCMHTFAIADSPETAAQPTHTARLVLFEFSMANDCVAGFKFHEPDAIAGGVAQLIVQVPGSHPVGPLLWLEWGKEKLHLAVASFGDGSQKDAPLAATAAVYYKEHLIGWTLFADSLSTFNAWGSVAVDLAPKVTFTLPFRLSDK